MGRSRYVITEPDKPHFLTCTVVEWLCVFTRPDAVQTLLDSWSHQRGANGLRLYGYVVLKNHIHFLAQAPRLDKCVASFTSCTARQLIELLEAQGVERILERLRFAKLAQKRDRACDPVGVLWTFYWSLCIRAQINPVLAAISSLITATAVGSIAQVFRVAARD